jgi:8-oxo-dGTP pyrophosphatase MutT (NUDIX family)
MTLDLGAAFDADAFRRHVRARLPADLPQEAMSPETVPLASDYLLGGPPPDAGRIAAARPAAVLVPIALRPSGPTLIFIQRADNLRTHSGQVAFPGGKIEADETAREAALREAHEEIGLEASQVEPLGWLDPYLTGTNYRIAPLVAFVAANFRPAVDGQEVAECFETPLSVALDPARFEVHSREFNGHSRKFYALPFDGRYIWGATAGMLRTLTSRLIG